MSANAPQPQPQPQPLTLPEGITEEDVQRAYAKIALDQNLTAQYVASTGFTRAVVPAHWRDTAIEHALEAKNEKESS